MTQDLEIIEVHELHNGDEHANLYLKAGWILLNTMAHPIDGDNGRGQRAVYVFGWPASLGPEAIHPPHPRFG